MLTVDEATRKILPFARVMKGAERLPLREAAGRILTHDVFASRDVPPHDNSAMDGYALNTADLGNSSLLPIAATVYAGDVPEALQPGTVMRIFTGSPVPEGADAVLIQEEAESNGESIIVQGVVRAGDNIRRRAEDIGSGELLFPVGHCLRAQDIGLLASLGLAEVMVFERLKVGILSTGNELLEPGEPDAPGKIYNSNRYLLTILLQDLGCDVIDAGRVPDDLTATEEALEQLSHEADIIVSTGGVSVGDADYVKAAVLARGDLNMWKIAVKPGKPLAFGSVNGKPFFGLPGNPVSAFVTFLLFVRPFLQLEQGGQARPLRRVPVPAGFDWPKAGKREEYLRVKFQTGDDGSLQAILYPNQGSGVLSSVCWADALLKVPAGVTFSQGDKVDCLLLDSGYRN